MNAHDQLEAVRLAMTDPRFVAVGIALTFNFALLGVLYFSAKLIGIL
jgi:hypothetical protein